MPRRHGNPVPLHFKEEFREFGELSTVPLRARLLLGLTIISEHNDCQKLLRKESRLLP